MGLERFKKEFNLPPQCIDLRNVLGADHFGWHVCQIPMILSCFSVLDADHPPNLGDFAPSSQARLLFYLDLDLNIDKIPMQLIFDVMPTLSFELNRMTSPSQIFSHDQRICKRLEPR